MRGGWALGLLAAVGCASGAGLSPEDRGQIERNLLRSPRQFLRVSCWRVPFFDDPHGELLTPWAPSELTWVAATDGGWHSPGQPMGILPAGTPVTLERLEFPSSTARILRPPGTPRDRIWVRVSFPGKPGSAVLVLGPGLATEGAVRGEIGRYLTATRPALWTAGWNEGVRTAVAHKETLPDMPADALESAWGPPEEKRARFEPAGRGETWIWAGGVRSATLLDGRLVDSHSGGP